MNLHGNDNNDGQIGVGGGNPLMPLPNPNPQSPTIARRILVLQNQTDIVSTLSDIATAYRQKIHVFAGNGFVSQVTMRILPSQEILTSQRHREIFYLSGWFQPELQTDGCIPPIPLSLPTGILHVCLAGNVPEGGAAIAETLITSGPVEVTVDFVCQPGSVVQPDAPGGPNVPVRIHIPPAP